MGAGRSKKRLMTAGLGLLLVASLGLCGNANAGAADKNEKKDAKAAPAGETRPDATAEGEAEAGGKSEYSCDADIFYSWKRVPQPAEPQKVAAKNAEPEDPDVYKPIEEFYVQSHAEADTKEEAELRLKGRLPELEANARKYCESVRQNRGKCVADRLAVMGPDYVNLDFEARRVVREQVSIDCMKNSGVCLAPRSGDLSCHESKRTGNAVKDQVAAPAPAPAAPAKKEEKKK